MVMTLSEKLSKAERLVEQRREEYKKADRKLDAAVRLQKKYMRQINADAVEAFWNETDPFNVDWDFAMSQLPGGPYDIDYSRTNKKVAELFGYEGEYEIRINQYMNRKTDEHSYFAPAMSLSKDDEKSRDKFKNAVDIALKVFDPIGLSDEYVPTKAWGYADEDCDLAEYVKFDITDDDLCAGGVPCLFIHPKNGDCVFGMTVYGSFRIKTTKKNLDAMLDWMSANGHTYH